MLTYWSATKLMGDAHDAARPCVSGAVAPRFRSQAGMSFNGINVGTTTRPLGLGGSSG